MACMLREAAVWRPESPRPELHDLLANPHVGHYITGWPRRDDFGVIAHDDRQLLGAAWCRRFQADDPGYGYLADDIPEITIATAAAYRGRGVGTAVLTALIEEARARRCPAVCLSVEQDNPATRLYARLGFVVAGVVGNAWTMILPFMI